MKPDSNKEDRRKKKIAKDDDAEVDIQETPIPKAAKKTRSAPTSEREENAKACCAQPKELPV